MSDKRADLDTLRKEKLASHLRGVLHEINNALGVVMINLSFIEDEMDSLRRYLPPDLYSMLKEACDDIETATRRINGYAKALTYVANPTFLEQPQPFEVGGVLDLILEFLHNFLKRRVAIKLHRPEVEEFFSTLPPSTFFLALIATIEELLNIDVASAPTGNVLDFKLDSVLLDGSEYIEVEVVYSELKEEPSTDLSFILKEHGGDVVPIKTPYGCGYRILLPASNAVH